jgi:hypothetical protein
LSNPADDACTPVAKAAPAISEAMVVERSCVLKLMIFLFLSFFVSVHRQGSDTKRRIPRYRSVSIGTPECGETRIKSTHFDVKLPD